ncbi:MAG TPA: hypothetical protein VNR00_11510 [Opitutus sp.]|nr:hypothetical protein [Opitutus sp.]
MKTSRLTGSFDDAHAFKKSKKTSSVVVGAIISAPISVVFENLFPSSKSVAETMNSAGTKPANGAPKKSSRTRRRPR